MDITVSIPDNLATSVQTEVDIMNNVGNVQNEPKYIPIKLEQYLSNVLISHAQMLNDNQINALVAKGTEAIKNLPDGTRDQVLNNILTQLGITKQ